ncbi:MAG: autotransporter outer membrane beta-barrel domain-containing protein [Paracoccaceae bacterium]|nr:autotransporter outer membrane beta-barrel domain-containing protein [Paracoccaceae bacterium]MDE2915926.1 autotransporter outer membrane beta-barrel domain-containing protein [Paracoccaceae bacterium]
MPYSSTRTYNHCALFYVVPNKVIFLFLSVLFLFFADDVGAQINCDSNPEIISEDTTNSINCSTNNTEIILENGVKIEPTTNNGISIGTSEDVSIIAKGNTLIKTTGNSQHGVAGNEAKSLTLKLNDIELEGKGVNGIWVQFSPSTPGNLTTIEVDNITMSNTDQFDSTSDFAGIKVRSSGRVDITSTGKISTKANFVDGILIQNSGDANGGNIDISVNDIETQGSEADGIRISSIGYEQSLEKEIDITVNGTIRTKGMTAHGIIVEIPDSKITVEIKPGAKVITENTDTNTFALVLAGAQSGGNIIENKIAVVENMGLVNGNILMEGCAQFNNYGTTISQSSIAISSTNCDTIGMKSGFFNFGTVDVGGKNNIKETTLTGNYYQENNGELVIDVDWSDDTIDLLTIDGSANLDGKLIVNSLGIPVISSFDFERGDDFTNQNIKQLKFLEVTDLITGNFQYISRTSPLLSNRVTKSADGKNLYLDLTFNLELLNRNQTNVFWGLNDSRSQSDDIDDVFFSLFSEEELTTLQKALDSFGNEIAGATVRSEFRNMERLTLPNDYCGNKPTGQADEFNRLSSKECKFFTAKIQNGSHSGNFEQRAHNDKLLEGIFRVPLFENKADGQIQLLGQINNTRIEISDFAKSDGYSGTLGLGYFQEGDHGKLSLLAHLGMGSHEISRSFTAIDKSLTSKGTLDTHSAGISAEISNSLEIWNGTLNWYARVGYSGVKSKSYTETGGEDFALIVDKTSTKSLVINPRFEFVGQSRNFQTLDIQPVVGGGILHRTKPAIEFHSKFTAGGDKILSTTVLPKTEFNYFLGTKFSRSDDNLNGEIGYSRYFSNGESLTGNKFSAKLIVFF